MCSALNLDAGSDTATVDRGQVYDFAVTIDSGAAEDAAQTCDVFAYDTDDRSTEDRASLTVETIASCPDADGDGVCDQFDQCPETSGAGSNAGCPLEERCGDGVDNDGDGQVNENCGEGGDGVFEKAAEFFETNLGIAGPVFATPFNGLDQISTDLSQVLENPVGNALLVIDLLVGLIAGLAAFRLGSSELITPFVETVAAATPVSEAVLRLTIGTAVAVAAGYVAYTLISSIVVKIVIAILLVAGAYVYIQVEAIVPG